MNLREWEWRQMEAKGGVFRHNATQRGIMEFKYQFGKLAYHAKLICEWRVTLFIYLPVILMKYFFFKLI